MNMNLFVALIIANTISAVCAMISSGKLRLLWAVVAAVLAVCINVYVRIWEIHSVAEVFNS